jgi:hypothetical protein
MWYYWDFGWVRLKSLQDWHVSNLYTHGTISRGRPDLQQPSQERYVVGPFLLGSIPEGQRALDASGISPEAFIFLVQGWDRASADVRRSPDHVTYSPLQHCAMLAGQDSSDLKRVVRRAAG